MHFSRIFTPLISFLLLVLTGCVSNSDEAGSPDLSNVQLTAGSLEPAFSSANTTYTIRIDSGITQLQVSPIQRHHLARTIIEDTLVGDGQYSAPIDIEMGDNRVDLFVTAQDGLTKKTYFLNIIRGPIDTTPSGDGDGDTGTTNGDGDTNDDGGSTNPDTDTDSDNPGDSNSDSNGAPTNPYLYQSQYLKPNTPKTDAHFSTEIAISGNTTVIGAPGEDQDKGAVYVFNDNGQALNQTQRITGSGLTAGDRFGDGLDIEGDIMVVGASGVDSNQQNSGAVFTYRLINGQWVKKNTLTPSTPGQDHRFGITVSLSGDKLAVATLRNDADSNQGGGIYIYSRSGEGWQQEAYLQGSTVGVHDIYSSSINLDGNILAAGSFSPDNDCTASISDPGQVRIYQHSGGNWEYKQTLSAPDGDGADRFGSSVDINDGTLAIGAMCEDGISNGNTQQGAAYVYENNGGSWQYRQKISASNGAAHSLFGDKVKVRSNTLIVSASYDSTSIKAAGSVYVFKKNGNTWQESTILRASNIGRLDRFGNSLAMDNATIMIGSPDEDSSSPYNEISNNSSNSGAVYVFR